jgi:hypothetical protein
MLILHKCLLYPFEDDKWTDPWHSSLSSYLISLLLIKAILPDSLLFAVENAVI